VHFALSPAFFSYLLKQQLHHFIADLTSVISSFDGSSLLADSMDFLQTVFVFQAVKMKTAMIHSFESQTASIYSCHSLRGGLPHQISYVRPSSGSNALC